MKLEIQGDTLRISEVKEFGATIATTVRDRARAALGAEQKNIEVDLSQTTFIDSAGLGALIALHKTACSRHGAVRLLHPQPQVRQLLELTRMHHLFDIAHH
jgi:anti-sigma B factor antagonist